jgi:hypothetical protein
MDAFCFQRQCTDHGNLKITAVARSRGRSHGLGMFPDIEEILASHR